MGNDAAKEVKVLGMGNPLLDKMTTDADVVDAMLAKYSQANVKCVKDDSGADTYPDEVKMGNAILATDTHKELFEAVGKAKDLKMVAGGATQNSIRVAKWMAKDVECGYMGCVGKDDTAKQMADLCAEAGVVTNYMEDESTPTGICSVLVKDGERSLITNLEAANNFKISHIAEGKPGYDMYRKAEIVYSSGFFLTVSPDSMVEVSEYCKRPEVNHTYCLNLAAPFLMFVPPFWEAMQKVFPNCTYIFGNETEAATLGDKMFDGEKDVEAVAKKLAAKYAGVTVVFTQGADKTIVATDGGETVATHQPEKLEKEKLVDTNGAGDAFVGGFLAGLAQGKVIDQCVAAGHYAAREIIQRDGCTVPEACDFNWE